MRSKLIHEESFLATHFTAEHGNFDSLPKILRCSLVTRYKSEHSNSIRNLLYSSEPQHSHLGYRLRIGNVPLSHLVVFPSSSVLATFNQNEESN